MAGIKGKSGRKRREGTTRTSVNLDNEVLAYLNRTGNQSAEIERVTRREMAYEDQLTQIAEAMYQELSGKTVSKEIAEAMYRELACADSVQEKTLLVDEICDWLYNGDNPCYTMADVPDLLKEWREYEGQTDPKNRELACADSVQEKTLLVGEIYDWLYNGDNPSRYSMADVPDLLKEWREYEGQGNE